MARLGLKRRADGEVVPYAASYVPLYMNSAGAKHEVRAVDRAGAHEDARSLVVDVLGESRLAPPESDVAFGVDCDR